MIESMTINLTVSKKVGGYKIDGVVAGVAVEAGIAERPGKP